MSENITHDRVRSPSTTVKRMEQPHANPTEPPRRNDRVVERYSSMGIEVFWFPPTRTVLGTRPKKVKGEVVDLSVSGALLLAPANGKVHPGTLAELELEGSLGVVEVRHVKATDDPGSFHYGLQLLRMEPKLRQRVYDLVAQHRGDSDKLEIAWRTAH
jgi:hypothetical protein